MKTGEEKRCSDAIEMLQKYKDGVELVAVNFGDYYEIENLQDLLECIVDKDFRVQEG